MIPQTMRAMVLATPNTPFVASRVPVIAPRQGEVCVRVAACAVGYRDILDRKGAFPFIRKPTILGHEFSGTVASVGLGVTSLKEGQKVVSLHWAQGQAWPSPLKSGGAVDSMFGLTCDGGYAEYATCHATAFCAAPETGDWSAADAAPVMSTFGTVWQGAVVRGGLNPTHHVLVTGASGGLGSTAIALCKAMGCRVTAVTSQASKVDFIRSLCPDEVVAAEGATTAFHKNKALVQSFDVVIECVGAPTMESSLRCVKPGGKLVLIGNVSNGVVPLPLGYCILNSISVVGSDSVEASQLTKLFGFLGRHKIRPHVQAVMPLEEAMAAHDLVENKKVHGRIVLDVDRAAWA